MAAAHVGRPGILQRHDRLGRIGSCVRIEHSPIHVQLDHRHAFGRRGFVADIDGLDAKLAALNWVFNDDRKGHFLFGCEHLARIKGNITGGHEQQ